MYKKINKDIRFNMILIIIFLTSIVFIYSTYAWFSSALDVKISDFRMTTNSTDGLFISLDGVTWSDRIDVSSENMENLLIESYQNHSTQWAYQLSPVSTAGIENNDKYFYNIFGTRMDIKHDSLADINSTLDFIKIKEDKPNYKNRFIAFDIFLKNKTPSPYKDNIYFGKSTLIEEISDDDKNDYILNATRIGIVLTDTTSALAPVEEIQNLKCNNKCKNIVYEQNYNKHDGDLVKELSKLGANIKDGEYYDTYSLIKEGRNIKIWSGIKNSKIKIDNTIFKKQENIIDFKEPLISLSNEIVKARLYLWVEGQDVDIIEHFSQGYKLSVNLSFEKDHASLN